MVMLKTTNSWMTYVDKCSQIEVEDIVFCWPGHSSNLTARSLNVVFLLEPYKS